MDAEQIESYADIVNRIESVMTDSEFYPSKENKQGSDYFELCCLKIIDLSGQITNDNSWGTLSKDDIAHQIGISERSIYRYCNGERRVPYPVQYACEGLLRDVYAEFNKD